MVFRPGSVPWNAGSSVLLRRAACYNVTKAELPDLPPSAMKFAMKFIPFLSPDSLALLDFRVETRAAGCRFCGAGETLIAHGYLRGHAAAGHGTVTRALRFFAPTGIRN